MQGTAQAVDDRNIELLSIACRNQEECKLPQFGMLEQKSILRQWRGGRSIEMQHKATGRRARCGFLVHHGKARRVDGHRTGQFIDR
jgi:hypothetical protein